MTLAFLIAVFVVIPALAIPFGKDSRILDRQTGWMGARARTP